MIINLKWLGLLLLMGIVASSFFFSSLFWQNNNAVQAEPLFNHVVVDNGGLSDIWLKTVGDVNGDGQVDLVAGGNASGGLAWYQAPNWTKRTIDSDTRFRTDGEVVDVDRDGDQDLVVLSQEDIRWYENPSWSVHVIDTGGMHDLEVSDFDGDGDVDLVIRNQSEFGHVGNELHFYRQDSPTSWSHRVVNCANGEGLKVVDVDRDGDQDVVVNGSWLENTKNILSGAWTSYSFTSSWTAPNAFVSAGDINGDGRVDLVMSPAELAGETYRISWFQAPMNPRTSSWAEHIVEDNVESVQHFLGVGDMDNDGDADLAAAEMEQGSNPDDVKIYLNGDRVGGTWVKQVIATTGSHSMRIVDLGKDGDLDLFGGNWEGNQVELWENDGCQSSLNSWSRHVIDPARPWRAIFITAADIDQDGRQDVVTGGWWYRNPGNVTGTWTRNTIGDPLNNMAAVSDFDGDGRVDVLGTMGQGSDPDSRFVWAHNNGAGSFSILSNVAEGQGDFLQGVAVGQFNSDGNRRVALSWHGAGYGIQALSVPAQPLTLNWTHSTLSPTSQDEALSVGDIDRDSDQDLLLGTIWLENKGATWSEHTLHDTSSAEYGDRNPDRNRLVDLNNDGRLDAIVGYEAISVSGKLAWYEQGNSATALWQEHLIARVVGPMSLDVVDMDQDGDLDVTVGEHNLEDPASARLLVFENLDGGGTQWQEHLVYQGDEHHDGAQTVDIDNDGDLDILSIGWEHDQVILYENTNVSCDNQIPETATPSSATPVQTDTSLTPLPVETVSVTTTPMPPDGSTGCFSGLILPMGLLFASAKVFTLLSRKRDL